jgi:hypothetical protein
MLPQFKLAMLLAKIGRKHMGKMLHANNPNLLTRDLGRALRNQKEILSDPSRGLIMTAYEVLEPILEVKALTVVVAKHLGIETKGKPDIAIMQEIIDKDDARNGGKYSQDIKDTLEWTRALFSHPEIQDVLKAEVTKIEKPDGMKDMLGFMGQIVSRFSDEAGRVNAFLQHAKTIRVEPNELKQPEPPKPNTPKGDSPGL